MHGPDVTVTRVYLTGDCIQIHLNRVLPSPPQLPAGFYWYGPKCKSPEHPPKWIEKLLNRTSPPAGPVGQSVEHDLGAEQCRGTDSGGLEATTGEDPETPTAETTTGEGPETPTAETTTGEDPETPTAETTTGEDPETPTAETTTGEDPETPSAIDQGLEIVGPSHVQGSTDVPEVVVVVPETDPQNATATTGKKKDTRRSRLTLPVKDYPLRSRQDKME